jgi:hypothetical protein
VSRSETPTKWILGTLSTPRGRKVFLCFAAVLVPVLLLKAIVASATTYDYISALGY